MQNNSTGSALVILEWALGLEKFLYLDTGELSQGGVMLILWGIAGASWCFFVRLWRMHQWKVMDTFLTVFQKSVQKHINIDPMGLSLCSVRSTVGELFVALPARFRLVSLANKHRTVCTPYRLKSIPLQAFNYQKAVAKSPPVNSAAECHRHLEGSSNRKVEILKKIQCLLMTISIKRRTTNEVIPRQFGPWGSF